eukprot:1930611-Pyramimonas_sp.AAC.2
MDTERSYLAFGRWTATGSGREKAEATEETEATVGLKRTSEVEREAYRRCKGARQTDLRVSLAGQGPRGEQWEKVGNWTQGEKKEGSLGCRVPVLAVTGTGGPPDVIQRVHSDKSSETLSSTTARKKSTERVGGEDARFLTSDLIECANGAHNPDNVSWHGTQIGSEIFATNLLD